MDANPGSVIVRTLRPDDRERLVRMDEELSGRRRTTWYENKLRRALDETDLRISLGAELDGILVGALLGSLDYGEFGKPEPIAILDTVLVDRSFSRQGVASAMLDQLMTNLRGLGIDRLRTEVAWTDLEITGFFARVGFQPVPRLVLELDVNQARSESETP